MSNFNSTNDTLDFSFHLFFSEIPQEKSKLIEKIKRYGVYFKPIDKLYFEDLEGDKIEIQEENLQNYLNVMGESLIKIIIKKYAFEDYENLENTGYHENLLLNNNNKISTKENIDGTDNILLNNNLKGLLLNNSFDNISFSESMIYNNQETCFILLTKKYLNELTHLLGHNYFEDEKNFPNFKNLLLNINHSMDFNSEMINFSEEDIRIATENLGHIHNFICLVFEKFYEKKKHYFNIISENNEKMKAEIILSQETRKNFKKFVEKFDKNKGIFNRFMIELTDHIADFDFYLKNDNFESEKFENNLSSLFSFIISLIYDFNNNLYKKLPFKSSKYEKLINDFMNKKYTLDEHGHIKELNETYGGNMLNSEKQNFQYYHLQMNKFEHKKRETIEIGYIIDNQLYDI